VHTTDNRACLISEAHIRLQVEPNPCTITLDGKLALKLDVCIVVKLKKEKTCALLGFLRVCRMNVVPISSGELGNMSK